MTIWVFIEERRTRGKRWMERVQDGGVDRKG